MAAKLTGPVAQIPNQVRGGGFWQDQFKNTLEPNPGTAFRYEDVSSSTASNLGRDYGWKTTTRTEQNDAGEKITVMYVTYLPDKVDEIKANYREKRAKAQAKKVDGGSPVKPKNSKVPANA